MNYGVQEHLTTIRRHWGKIAFIVFVSVMATGAVAMLSSKVYTSHARILLLNSSPAERASRPSTNLDSGGFSSPQDQVLTQVAILRSPALAETLAIQLGPERVLEEMTWRWDWLRALPGTYKDKIILRMYDFQLTAQLLQTIGMKKPTFGTSTEPPVEAARDKIMNAIRAEAIVKTDMFSVAFSAPSGDFAAEALDGMIEVYVKHMVELRRPLDTAAIAQKEAERLEMVLGEAEEELRAFSQEYDILSIERQKDLLLDRWSRLQDELSRAQGSQRETAKTLSVLEREIETLPRQESISVTTRPNPVIDNLRQRLVQLQAELQRYVEGSAAAIRLRREIDTISAQLQDEDLAVSGQQTVGNSTLYQELTNRVTLAAANKEALEVRIAFLNKELETVDAELRRVVGHEMEYRQLSRTVDAREEAYRFALLKREETAIQTLITQSNLAQVVPVEPSDIPSRASAPRRARLIALGLMAGLFAGIGIAYLFEFSRRTISTVDEARVALGLPVLAVTERFGLVGKRLKQTRLDIRRFAVWAMRQVVPERGVRMLFASAHRLSGQTMIVTELAASLQKQGNDVVTLRLELNDRRSPKVLFKANAPKPGTSCNEVVTVRAPSWDMNRSVEEVLQQICTKAGPPVAKSETSEPDASAEKRDLDLLELPHGAIILIDAPDFSKFPELGSVAELADRLIPVVEADRTRISEIRDVIDALQATDTELPGVVLTKRRMTESSWAFGWMAATRRKTWETI